MLVLTATTYNGAPSERLSAAFDETGGRADEWRFQVPLPAIVAKLDRAAGLNHRELTGRSLWMGARHAF